MVLLSARAPEVALTWGTVVASDPAVSSAAACHMGCRIKK